MCFGKKYVENDLFFQQDSDGIFGNGWILLVMSSRMEKLLGDVQLSNEKTGCLECIYII